MNHEKYRLTFLPCFYGDLDEKISYIWFKLKNQKAANDLYNLLCGD